MMSWPALFPTVIWATGGSLVGRSVGRSVGHVWGRMTQRYPGRFGSAVPFSLFLLRAELPAQLGRPAASVDALLALRRRLRDDPRHFGLHVAATEAAGVAAEAPETKAGGRNGSGDPMPLPPRHSIPILVAVGGSAADSVALAAAPNAAAPAGAVSLLMPVSSEAAAAPAALRHLLWQLRLDVAIVNAHAGAGQPRLAMAAAERVRRVRSYILYYPYPLLPYPTLPYPTLSACGGFVLVRVRIRLWASERASERACDTLFCGGLSFMGFFFVFSDDSLAAFEGGIGRRGVALSSASGVSVNAHGTVILHHPHPRYSAI
jgi:hypothetical protein